MSMCCIISFKLQQSAGRSSLLAIFEQMSQSQASGCPMNGTVWKAALLGSTLRTRVADSSDLGGELHFVRG